MGKKETMLELRHQIYEQLTAFVADLDEAQRAVEGQPDAWAIKNELIHVALWDERLGNNLQRIGRGEDAIDYTDFQAINDQDFEDHRQDSWEQVEAMLERSQKAIMAGYQALDAEMLLRTDLLHGGGERPAWMRVAGTSLIHPMLHMSEYMVNQGQAAQAKEMVDGLSQAMAALDEGDVWQGNIIYNQACYYALSGDKEKAIQLLAKSLPLNPTLTEWSQQDPDLESLREEPAYQALYAVEAEQ